MERVYRPAPPEPLLFCAGHKYGSIPGSGSVAESLTANVGRMLAGIEQLDYRRCGWGDEEASWLAVVLPMCANLKRLLLTGNQIGNAGGFNITRRLAATAQILAPRFVKIKARLLGQFANFNLRIRR